MTPFASKSISMFSKSRLVFELISLQEGRAQPLRVEFDAITYRLLSCFYSFLWKHARKFVELVDLKIKTRIYIVKLAIYAQYQVWAFFDLSF